MRKSMAAASFTLLPQHFFYMRSTPKLANTLRVSFGGSKWNNQTNTRNPVEMDKHTTFNGMLDESGPPLQDIVDAVAEVKEKMEI